jgi:hypothetical protein
MHQDGILFITVLLFVFSGVMALVLDVKILKRDKLDREKKTAYVFGWINVSLGLMVYVGFWVYEMYFF